MLAARLSENPSRKVLLLEAGPAYPTRNELPVDLADGSRLPFDRGTGHDWGWATTGALSGAVVDAAGHVHGIRDRHDRPRHHCDQD